MVSAMAKQHDGSPLKDWKRWPALARIAARLPSRRLQALWPTGTCKPMASRMSWAALSFRTTGYNSVRTLAARIALLRGGERPPPAICRCCCAYAPKSTTLSYRTPVYYVDLTLRDDSTLAQSASSPTGG